MHVIKQSEHDRTVRERQASDEALKNELAAVQRNTLRLTVILTVGTLLSALSDGVTILKTLGAISGLNLLTAAFLLLSIAIVLAISVLLVQQILSAGSKEAK